MLTDRPWPALLLTAAAFLAWPAPAVRRYRGLLGRTGGRRSGAAPPAEGTGQVPAGAVARPAGAARRRWLLAGAAGVAAAVLIGGLLGIGVAVAVVLLAERLLHRSDDDRAALRRSLEGDLPGACDLLAVCLGAGLPVGGALAAVGATLPAPLGRELQAVASLYRLGADPRRAWAEAPAELSGLGRTLVRAGESGSTVVPALHALAAEGRAVVRSRTEADVRRAGVWVLAPLGVCFLPAFLCLGVVPLVLGIAGDVFG